MNKRIFLAALLAFPLSAFAHSPLLSSEPSNNARLEQSPDSFQLSFKREVRLLKLKLEGAQELVLKPGPDAAQSSHHELPLPTALAAGKYIASWRAMGEDGHLMKGRIKFSIR